MEKVLISACLIGDNTKYDGTNNYIKDIEKLYPLCDLVIICPEVFGGLSTPRSPSEIKNGRVINKKGKDVTSNFNTGANMSLFIAKQNNVKYAILKENVYLNIPVLSTHLVITMVVLTAVSAIIILLQKLILKEKEEN